MKHLVTYLHDLQETAIPYVSYLVGHIQRIMAFIVDVMHLQVILLN